MKSCFIPSAGWDIHPHLQSQPKDQSNSFARLRARFRLRPADALQVAAGLANDASAFVTNDHSLHHLQEVIDVVVLDDYQLLQLSRQ